MKKSIQISLNIKDKIAKYRDELIGLIFLLLAFISVLIAIIYIKQIKTLDNQRDMLFNDQVTIEQNAVIIDSISTKWEKSYENLKKNGTKKTRPN